MRPRSEIRGSTRRSLLLGAGAAAVWAAAPAMAQDAVKFGPPAHAKGPPVFLDYDQVELDAAYDQSVYEPNISQVGARFRSNSEAVRARIGAPTRFAYGPSRFEGLDLYKTTRPDAPVFILIHGGEWRFGSAQESAFPAETFVHAGAHYVVPDYQLVQDAGGSLMPMADQMRRAVAWVARNAASFGGDPGRIYVAGHSAGGHLAGVVLTTDWSGQFGLPPDIVKGGICVSGMYDLKPVRLSFRRNYVAFDDAMEAALSPQRHLDKIAAPLIVAYGSFETPEFQRQGRDFAAAVKAAGKPVEVVVGDNYAHLEMMESFASPYGLMGRAALRLMKLA